MRHRSDYLRAEVGLALALALVIGAFSVETGSPVEQPGEPRHTERGPIELIDLPPTVFRERLETPTISDPDLPPVATPFVDEFPTTVLVFDPPVPTEFPGLPVPPELPPKPAIDLQPTSAYVEHDLVDVAEVMPELIGGIEALQSSIEYPEFARRVGIEGRVFLQFIVNEDGSVSDVEVLRGIGGGCDEEAVAAVRNARFTPGIQGGKPVRVRFALPVTFRLR